MRIVSLIGAVLSLLAFPLVFVTTQALVDLWPARPPQADAILFLDYQTFALFEWAFVASQGWLLCALTMWRMPSAPRVLRGLVLVVAGEALVVYGIVGFLRARGYEL